jgi:ABC-type uncharacterized transport system involved in gliding motility auxiliary subunit
MSNAKTKRWIKVGSGAAGLLVMLSILIAANVIIGNIRIRADLTEDKLYSLSEGTRGVLKKLNTDVRLILFVNDSAPEVPVFMKNYARQVEDLLREYEIASGGRITLEKRDPKPDSDDEELAQRYGITPQTMDMYGSAFHFGIVALVGTEEAVLPVLDPRTEGRLEYDLTRLIYRATRTTKPVVGVISALPVLGSAAPNFSMPGMPMPPQQRPWLSFKEIRDDFNLREIPPQTTSIDPSIEALIIVHPKDLPETTLFAIDQFVLRGGRVLAFLDPMSAAEMESQGGQDPYGMRGGGGGSNLEKLFKAWGVTYNPMDVLADFKCTSRVRGGNNQVEDSPVWLSLRAANINRDDMLTAQLDSLLLPFAGTFSAESTPDLKVTALLTTSDSVGDVSAMSARFGNQAIRTDFKKTPGQRKLAIRLSGSFKTAFPNGRPAAKPEDGAPQPTPPAGEPLKEGKSPAVILVGDSDMLFDRFCVEELNFFGASAVNPINDNLNFLANAVEQIAGSADLIGVRSRGRFNRPFTKVIEMLTDANQALQEQEKALGQRLQETQRQLRELQSTRKDQNQNFILSPEQKRAIDNFRLEEQRIKRELRNVSKNLRHDIEQLGTIVKLSNIALIPFLVSMAGIGFALYRRSK